MNETTNMHHGAHPGRSRPGPAHPSPVVHATRGWSRPDTVRADAAIGGAGGGG